MLGYGNNLYYHPGGGRFLDLVLLTLVAYPLSRSGFRGKKDIHEPDYIHHAVQRRTDSKLFI